MDKNIIEELNKLRKIFGTDKIMTSGDISQVLEGVMKIMNSFKTSGDKANNLVKAEMIYECNQIVKKCMSQMDSMKSDNIAMNDKIKSDMSSKMDEINSLKDEIIAMKPKDGETPKMEDIVMAVMKEIVLPQYKETVLDGPNEIANKLETLTGADRLSYTAINGLEEFIASKVPARAGGNTIGGGVTQIKAGAGITITSTGAGGRGVITITSSAAGAEKFTDLTDVPNSYTGQGGKGVRVKADVSGLEFYTLVDTDEKVKLSALDPTAGYLNDKITTGTGISYNNGLITNTAPDQTVAFTNGTGISVTGTYPNFTITNSAPSPFADAPSDGSTYGRKNGAWSTITSGSGDVIGPATNTDGYIPLWNGANSKTLKDGLAVPAGGLAGLTALGTKLDSSTFSDTGVTSKLITGFVSGAGTVAATDTILQAINKLDGNIAGKQASSAILAALAGLTYVSGTPFVKMTGASAFSLDTSTYLTTVTAHNLLSATHGDTLADTVVRGDIIYGNSTPKWARLPFPATPTGKLLQATATDVAWSTNALTIGVSASISGSNTGDQTITLTGNVTGSGTGSFATTIAANAVTLGMMATLVANSVIGNLSGSTVTPVAVSAVSTATASTIMTRDANGNTGITNVLEGYATTVTSASPVTLTVASKFDQYFTGSTAQTVVMPVVTTLALGQAWWITNSSSAAITVNSSGSNAIIIIAANTSAIVTCIKITADTTAAAWSVTYLGIAPATGKSLTVSNTLTFTGTDGSSVAFGTGGTVVYSGGALGTPSTGTLTNCTGLPIAGLTASTSTALGVGSIELGHATDTTIARSGAGVVTIEGKTIATSDNTLTLTNKRIGNRVTSTTSYTTDTGTSLDVSVCDVFQITAQAGALKFNNPGGTPVESDDLWIRIKDNGTARALTWDTQFRGSSDLALPSTTILSKTLYMRFKFNNTDTKWDLLAALNNFT